MAQEIVYNIKANASGATKSVKGLNNALEDTSQEAVKASTQVGGIEKAGKKGGKGLSFIKKGVKGIGTALKGAGIGLLLAGLSAIFEAIKRNQAIMDGFETVINFITVSVGAVTKALSDAYNSVSEATDGFDALKKVVMGVIDIALSPLKLAFLNIKAQALALKYAWETLFGDEEGVKRAKANLLSVKEEVIQLGKDTIQAGKDIANNIVEAASEVGKGIVAVVENVKKIDPKKLVETAKNMTKLGNSAAIAAAKQAQLVEEFDRQAESQRQLRDDTSLSIEARKKANDELGKILQKQKKAMLDEAILIKANAQAQFDANGNQENKIALIEAETNRLGVLAQINGFVSEQKVNAIALQKEEIDLTLSQKEADATLAFEKRKFAAEQITDLELRLATLLSINEDERLSEITRLEEKRDNFKQGTQAYVDAQNELNAKKQEFAQTDTDLKAQEKERKATELQAEIDNDLLTFETRREALRVQRQAILDDETLTEKERKKMLEENSQASITIAQKEADAKQKALSSVGDALTAFSSLAGKETQAGKAMATAAALINTYKGISEIWGAKAEGTASTTLLSKIAASAVVGIQGFKAVQSINAVKVPNGGGGSSGGAPSKPQAPSFNVVGQSPASANTISNQTDAQIDNSNNNPIQAYVVSTDISDQQTLDRDIEGQNSIG